MVVGMWESSGEKRLGTRQAEYSRLWLYQSSFELLEGRKTSAILQSKGQSPGRRRWHCWWRSSDKEFSSQPSSTAYQPCLIHKLFITCQTFVNVVVIKCLLFIDFIYHWQQVFFSQHCPSFCYWLGIVCCRSLRPSRLASGYVNMPIMSYRHLIIPACNCHCQSAEFDDGPAVSNNLHLSRAISKHKLSLLKQDVAIPSTLWWEVKPTERNPQGRSPFFLLFRTEPNETLSHPSDPIRPLMTAYSYFIHSQHHLLRSLLRDRTHYSYNPRSMTYDFKVTVRNTMMI